MPSLTLPGLDPTTGAYARPPISTADLTRIALGEKAAPDYFRRLKLWVQQHVKPGGTWGVPEGVDPTLLDQAGWGVIFPFQSDPAIKEALGELLAWRQAQAGERYREFLGKDGYRPNEDKLAFLERHGVGPGPAVPWKVPYYLLLVGSPQEIPFDFQTQLDVEYAVGRLYFTDVQDYARYAQTVIQSESDASQPSTQPLQLLTLFGVRNPDDEPTILSADQLVSPLTKDLTDFLTSQPSNLQPSTLNLQQWNIHTHLGPEATKATLASLLGGADTPSLLFTASHGLELPPGDRNQPGLQGALVCQDWPGPLAWREPFPADFYFSGADLPASADLGGLIAFHFACYSLGTPDEATAALSGALLSGAARPTPIGGRPVQQPLLSSLPQRMLTQGAQAVIGHVDRAFGYSFSWGEAGSQTIVFRDACLRMMKGLPVGYAMEKFNDRYAELASDLNDEREKVRKGKRPDELAIAMRWTATQDARNYAILGDPAVRVRLAGVGAGAGEGVRREELIPSGTATEASPGVDRYTTPARTSPPGFRIAEQTLAETISTTAAEQLWQSLLALESLEISTYASTDPALERLEGQEFPNSRLVARTRISLDGKVTTLFREAGLSDQAAKFHRELLQGALAGWMEGLQKLAIGLEKLADEK